jgi:hypothetical protein
MDDLDTQKVINEALGAAYKKILREVADGAAKAAREVCARHGITIHKLHDGMKKDHYAMVVAAAATGTVLGGDWDRKMAKEHTLAIVLGPMQKRMEEKLSSAVTRCFKVAE